MAGFGVVWAALFIIIVTPLLGGLLTKLAFDLSEQRIRLRERERRYASTLKESTLKEFVTFKSYAEEEATIRSKYSIISEKKHKSHKIRAKINEIRDELRKLNEELEK